MKKIIALILSFALVFSLAAPAFAIESLSDVSQANNVTTIYADGTTYTIQVTGCDTDFTVIVTSEKGYYGVADVTVDNTTATILTSDGISTIDLPTAKSSLSPFASSNYTKKGTIVYNAPIGTTTPVSVDFLYRLTATDSGVVNLYEAEGKTLEYVVGLFGVLLGTAVGVASTIAGALVGVAFLIVSEEVVVLERYVMANWEDYICMPCKGGVYAVTPQYGTAYFIKNSSGQVIETYYDNITPYNWTDAHTALQFFTAFHSPAVYNGVMYFDWA